MKKQVYDVDEKGFITEIFLGNFDDDGNLLRPKGNFITTDLPQPLPYFKPRWRGTEWVEGATQEEIDAILNRPILLSDNQILGQSLSEREIQEIIQGQQISDLEIRMLMGGL